MDVLIQDRHELHVQRLTRGLRCLCAAVAVSGLALLWCAPPSRAALPAALLPGLAPGSAPAPADVLTPAPVITSITPTSGSAAGGTTVTITGVNFDGAIGVFFGDTPVPSFEELSSTEITAVAPAGLLETVDVQVATPGGLSTPTPADEFTYETTAPELSRISESNKTWYAENRRARVSEAERVPGGTTFSFTLNEQATVVFSFTKITPTGQSRRACVPPAVEDSTTGTCTLITNLGTLTVIGESGPNEVQFWGLLKNGRRLTPGGYKVAIIARNTEGEHSRAISRPFTVVATPTA